MADKAREWLHTLEEEARKLPAPPPPVAPVPPPPAAKPDLEVHQAPSQPATSPAPPMEEETPVYKKWWLWTAVGVVAAGAITGIVLASRPKNVEVPGVRDFDPQAFK